ncbi:DUF2971 domain-containing protein [Mycobacteroides abscessus]|uniref:DUF2971 domain-containing protein n=1 Tax=Mycobacteroides abscessus TaxID=36809 RepID=UPI00266DD059|nr:DUF2971 domain-containing protein [Mycobacteroides abscessus]MDO3334051.1 DUF2971 domain-containing protein [Mycobacteroides abscessus subsp. bolletii]
MSREDIAEWAVFNRSQAAAFQSDGHLYHYTDAGGLKGILDSEQLWGTHAAYLNDSQEFAYGVEAISNMIADYAEWVKEPEAGWKDPEAGSTIIGGVRNQVLIRAKEVLEDEFAPFVTCFSVYADELSQWRGYANGGYAICFDKEVLRQNVEQVRASSGDLPLPDEVIKPQLRAVEYIPKKQYESVTNLVDAHITGLAALLKHEDKSARFKEAEQRLISLIVPMAASMKHHSFVSEAEERLICHTSETFYTPSRIGLIPRVRFSFPPTAVRKVIVGPSPLDDVKQRSLTRYLKHKYPHVEVVPSAVPYREL